jgi:hypothetical protein
LNPEKRKKWGLWDTSAHRRPALALTIFVLAVVAEDQKR